MYRYSLNSFSKIQCNHWFDWLLMNCLQQKYFVTTIICTPCFMGRRGEMVSSCSHHFLYLGKKFRLNDSPKVKRVISAGGNIPHVRLLKLSIISSPIYSCGSSILLPSFYPSGRGPSPTPTYPHLPPAIFIRECPILGPGACIMPLEAFPRTFL